MIIYPWDSNKWNFLAWLSTLGAEKEKWITTISSMIIKNTSGERQDEFWASTADKLLKALMSILLEIASPIATIKDNKLTEYAEQLKDLRQRRSQSKTLEEKHLSRIVPGISGKQLFEQNEDKDCMIESFTWDDKIKEVGTLRVSFYQPIREQLLEKIKAMKVNDIYSATIMRYIPSKDNGRTTYIVAKTDIGVEVVCLLPNWNRPPVVMDSVKVKIVAIAPQGQESLVLGAIKR